MPYLLCMLQTAFKVGAPRGTPCSRLCVLHEYSPPKGILLHLVSRRSAVRHVAHNCSFVGFGKPRRLLSHSGLPRCLSTETPAQPARACSRPLLESKQHWRTPVALATSASMTSLAPSEKSAEQSIEVELVRHHGAVGREKARERTGLRRCSLACRCRVGDRAGENHGT